MGDEEGDRLWRRRRRQVQTQGSSSSRSQNQSQCGRVAHVARGRGKQMRKKEHQLTPDSLASSSRSLSLDQSADPTVAAAAIPAVAAAAAALLTISRAANQFRATAITRAAVEGAAG